MTRLWLDQWNRDITPLERGWGRGLTVRGAYYIRNLVTVFEIHGVWKTYIKRLGAVQRETQSLIRKIFSMRGFSRGFDCTTNNFHPPEYLQGGVVSREYIRVAALS